MGSSLRRKKRAKSKSGKKTVKVGRVKKTSQKVTVAPVLLPGAVDATAWNEDTTHQHNYAAAGLASDPNKIGKTGRNAVERREERAGGGNGDGGEHDDGTVAARATVGGDEVRGAMGEVRSTGFAPPKRLTTKQRRIVGALVAKHGETNLPAMFRDRKLNAMQHTIAQLRELVVSYVAYPELVEVRSVNAGTRTTAFAR